MRKWSRLVTFRKGHTQISMMLPLWFPCIGCHEYWTQFVDRHTPWVKGQERRLSKWKNNGCVKQYLGMLMGNFSSANRHFRPETSELTGSYSYHEIVRDFLHVYAESVPLRLSRSKLGRIIAQKAETPLWRSKVKRSDHSAIFSYGIDFSSFHATTTLFWGSAISVLFISFVEPSPNLSGEAVMRIVHVVSLSNCNNLRCPCKPSISVESVLSLS